MSWQKKKKGSSKNILGKALINQREKRRRAGVTLEEEDEYIPDLQSKTEENSLEEFLAKADLAGTEFAGERENIRVISKESEVVGVNEEELKDIRAQQEKFQSYLVIPRRPHWDSNTEPEELKQKELAAFYAWRTDLAELESESGLVITPYEKNVELWRQLWRVLERSDVVIQILDSRNPLLFRCRDLEKYVKEIDASKKSVILLNKADLLSKEQRELWADYFENEGTLAYFWSALAPDSEDEIAGENQKGRVLSPEQLVQEFHKLLTPFGSKGTIGMVGYPNVGKSSTINCLLGLKKVPVSSTPGKTRHFQTLALDESVTLCDCPGLVTPSFTFGREDMLLNGILAVSQMREYRPAVRLLCSRVPQRAFESLYGISLPKREERVDETEDMVAIAQAESLLTSVAFVRGFMSSKGIPDQSRAARLILKDVNAGKLCWAAAPPGSEQTDYNEKGQLDKYLKGAIHGSTEMQLEELLRRNLIDKTHSMDVDNSFFPEAHVKKATSGTKPNSKKHFNPKKKEKLRKVYGYMDA